MKNKPKRNNKIIRLSLALSVCLMTLTANAQDTEVLKRAGINVVSGFGLPGSPERVNTIRSNNNRNTVSNTATDQETRSAGSLPANSTLQGDANQTNAKISSDTYEQHNQLNDAITNINGNAQKSLDKLSGKDTANNSINGNQTNKKKVTVLPKQTSGPKLQSVDITHFNQETLKEMEAYGKSKQEEEYLKFRLEASKHKNPPIQIRRP